MSFVTSYKNFDIYKSTTGEFSIMMDSPDGLLPVAKRQPSLEEAMSLIDKGL